MMKLTNETLIQILKVHSPIKARKIADMLSRDFGRVERKEVNSLLYRMKAKSITVINDKYEWSLKQESGKGSSKSTKSIKLDESPKIEPEICFSEDQERIIKFDLSGNLLVRGQAGSGKTTVLTARAGRCFSLTIRGSLLFLTYNAALCSYVKKIFKTVKSREELNVETFHQWTSASAKKMGYKIKSWVNQTERQEQLTDIIENAKRINYDGKTPLDFTMSPLLSTF